MLFTVKRSRFMTREWPLDNLRTRFVSALVLAAVVTLFTAGSSLADFHDRLDAPLATPSGLVLEDDCVVDLALSGSSKALIRYTISCAVRETRILVKLKPGAKQEFTRVSRRIAPKGPGALGHARCTLVEGERSVVPERRVPWRSKAG